MTNIKFNLMVRVIINRINQGEKLDDIITSFPKLSEKDKKDLEEEVKKILD